MVDIENEVFKQVSDILRPLYEGIYITGEYVKTPSAFPCVSLIEMDNSVSTRTQDSSGKENHAVLMYEFNVYSNKQSGKKSECRNIAKLVSDLFQQLGFTRIMLEPIPNIEDINIYRMTGRYTATVSKEHTIYRR